MYYLLGYLAIGFCSASWRISRIGEETWQEASASLPADQKEAEKKFRSILPLTIFCTYTLSWPINLIMDIVRLFRNN